MSQFQQNISIQKSVITSANVEKVVSLPSTRVFSLRIMPDVCSTIARLSFTTGIVSTDGGTWWTIGSQGFAHDDLYLTKPKIYLALVTGLSNRIIRVMSIT